MSDMSQETIDDYLDAAESWAEDRNRAAQRSGRIAWIVAGIAALIAVLEAFALFALLPLRRDVPYTLLVDRQTGYVQALRPLEEERINADSALTRSFLAQYVTAREAYALDQVQENYRKVGLWSTGEARNRYVGQMRGTGAGNPIAALPPGATIAVQIRSISSLATNKALVRFDTVLTDRGGRPQLAQNWASVVDYQYSDAGMSAEDRLVNPLGFQVTRYRKDAETLPRELTPSPQAAPVAPIAPGSLP